MKNVSLLALASVMAPAVARAEEPRDLLVTVTTAHVLPSVRTAEALARKLSAATSDLKLEAMANVFLGLDRGMAEALEGPVDLALLKGLGDQVLEDGAFSIAWRDPSRLRGLGAPGLDGVRKVPLDASPVLQQLGASVGGGKGACALYPTPAPPGQRLVCASSVSALAKLGPYLARDVALEERSLDVSARIPVRELLESAERDGTVRRGEGTEAEQRAGDEVLALARDVSSAAVGLAWNPSELSIAFDARFAAANAASTKMLLSAEGRGRTMPSLFGQLPADTFAFGTWGGVDPAVARAAAQRGVDLVAAGGADGANLGAAMLRPLADTLASRGFAFSFAVGLDAKRALPVVEAQRRKPSPTGADKVAKAITPWIAVEADGLAEASSMVESVMQIAGSSKPFDLPKGAKWPSGTKAWQLADAGVVAVLPREGSVVVLYGSDGSLVSEKLKAFAGLPGARFKVDDTTREVFRDRPSGVFVVTDRVGELVNLSGNEDSIDETLKALREDVKRKDPTVQIPLTLQVKGATASNGWLGSVRLDARYPVKALQAIGKSAKKLQRDGAMNL